MSKLFFAFAVAAVLVVSSPAHAVQIFRGYVNAGSSDLHLTLEETDPGTSLPAFRLVGIVGAIGWASSATQSPQGDGSSPAPFMGYVAQMSDVGLMLPDIQSDTDPSVTGPFMDTMPASLGVNLTSGIGFLNLGPAGQGETYLGFARMDAPIGEWRLVDENFNPEPAVFQLFVIAAPEPNALLLLGLATGAALALRRRARS